MWRCPVCHEALALDGDAGAWGCRNGHRFDVAREGYVHLLVTHQRRQREPGDSADMVRRRRAFLEAGHYRPLADAVERALGERPAGCPVLDAGCGEGWYARQWEAAGHEMWGVDIAKAAVRAAARRAGAARHRFAVGSSYDLPVLDGRAGAVVSVFSPLHTPEFARVLSHDGILVTATPGPRHLWELKALLFEEPEEHPAGPPFPGADRVEAVDVDLELRGAGVAGDLLGMTPYAWYVAPEVRARIEQLDTLDTRASFTVATYRGARFTA